MKKSAMLITTLLSLIIFAGCAASQGTAGTQTDTEAEAEAVETADEEETDVTAAAGTEDGDDAAEDEDGATVAGINIIHQLTEVKTNQYFEDEVPSDEDIVTILKAGINAESAMNSQNWHFTAVTDKSLMQEIADGMSMGMPGGAGRERPEGIGGMPGGIAGMTGPGPAEMPGEADGGSREDNGRDGFAGGIHAPGHLPALPESGAGSSRERTDSGASSDETSDSRRPELPDGSRNEITEGAGAAMPGSSHSEISGGSGAAIPGGPRGGFPEGPFDRAPAGISESEHDRAPAGLPGSSPGKAPGGSRSEIPEGSGAAVPGGSRNEITEGAGAAMPGGPHTRKPGDSESTTGEISDEIGGEAAGEDIDSTHIGVTENETFDKEADEGTEEAPGEDESIAEVPTEAAESADSPVMLQKAGVADAPLIIIVSCGEGNEFDAGLACQAMNSTALALGYATKIISSPTIALNGENAEEWKERLGIPEDMSATAVLLIGQAKDVSEYDADAVTGPSTRKDYDELVTVIE